MLTCNDANVLIVRTIDDARLSGGERMALRRHLASCARCRVEYETQHEVRRLLVLHIQDRLPSGFDERLRARLAQTSRPLPVAAPQSNPLPLRYDGERGTPAPFAAPRQTNSRGRIWALRLIPLAATLMLIVAGTFVRDVSRQSVVVPRSTASSGATQPRAFTTIVLPRENRASRSRRPSSVSADAEEVASAPAESPLADEGERHAAVTTATSAATTSGAAAEYASRAAKVTQGTSDAVDRVPASEPRGRERDRVASREDGAGGERADEERAASQRQGILPRPSAPIPHARPAMPAPFPDRTIPPP